MPDPKMQTFHLSHTDEGAGWTTLHPDGTQSYAQVSSGGPFFWRITLRRTYPDHHPIAAEGFGAQLVFGSLHRAERKAAQLLERWDRMYAETQQGFAEGFELGLRGGLEP
jgi:hypothetical protein